MDWKQIETKWGEMAHRVCADARCGESIDSAGLEFLSDKSKTSKKVKAKQSAVVSAEINQKRETVSSR